MKSCSGARRKRYAVKTWQLINAITADVMPQRSLRRSFLHIVVFGIAADALIFFTAVGPRPDIAVAAGTWRFLFKFVVVFSLAIPATRLTYRLAAPALWRRCRYATLVVPLGLLRGAAMLELGLVPRSLWMVRIVGSNSVNCMTLIPLLAMPPLACFLMLLRDGAPLDPGLAGALPVLLQARSPRCFMRSTASTTVHYL